MKKTIGLLPMLFILLATTFIAACAPATPTAAPQATQYVKPTLTTSSEPIVTPLPLAAKPPKTSIQLKDRILSFAIHPNQSSIAIGTIHSLFVYDLKTFELIHSSAEKNGTATITSLAWSPDGSKLAAGDQTIDENTDSGIPHLLVWDAKTWQVIFEPSFTANVGNRSIPALAWSADNRSLAVSVPTNQVIVYDTQSGQAISTQQAFDDTVTDLVWSPDGTQVVAARDVNNALRRWKVSNSETVSLLDARLELAYRLAWSPDGKQIASAHRDGVLCLWTAAANTCDTYIQAEPKAIYGLAWSADGTKLVTGGNAIRIWDAATGKLLSIFGADKSTTYLRIQWPALNQPLVTFQSDASQNDATSVRFWDVATGQVLTEFVK